MFRHSSEFAFKEFEQRQRRTDKMLRFGIDYLDDAGTGIAPSDLILLGASSGAGKTQLCCNITLSNIADGKRVAYFALEADLYEIEARIKYQMVANSFFAKPVPLPERFSFDNWYMGYFSKQLEALEAEVASEYLKRFGNLFIYYKQKNFGVKEFVQGVAEIADQVDLICVDHCHYFDFDDDNENRALKEIAKTARTLALEENKPIILVAHLRKRDRHNKDLVPGMDEFHGSSDLAKIATKIITVAPGKFTAEGTYETYFRMAKNRWNGGTTRHIGKAFFSPKTGRYEPGYRVGWANQSSDTEFAEVDVLSRPGWAKRADARRTSAEVSNSGDGSSGKPVPAVKNWAPRLSNRSGND